jgi:molecular chaperone DnaK
MATVGIDLGTTFSAIAHLDEHGKPVTIPNSDGELTTPSVVLFDRNGEIVVGREARRVALSEPDRVAEDVKRYMGDTTYPKAIDGKKLSPPAISALILKKLKQDAERRIGPVDGAVITVPAYFDEGRRQATAAAGQIAGLNVLDIINEPTSAALAFAYGIFSKSDKPHGGERIVVVYDLGGGTFDVTALRIRGKDLTVLATAGDVRLGGRDWDERLFAHMAEQFQRQHGLDPRDDPMSRQALMLQAEETKKILSQRQQTRFVVTHAGKSLSGQITREQFDEMTADLLYRSEMRLDRVMEQAKLDWAKVDQVLATGGSTRMPQVQEMLLRISGKAPDLSLSPDEAVAQGAAIYAAMFLAKSAAAPKPQPPPLPPLAKLAPTNAPPPPLARPATTNAPPPLAKAVTPDSPLVEAQPGSGGLIGQFADKVLNLLRTIKTTNVNAHSLGVVVHSDQGKERVSVLIPHNTALPVSVTKRYGTIHEHQSTVTVRIVEGESRQPGECIPVGSCQIKLVNAKLPKGSPIDVTFTYDNSGRLNARAVEPSTGIWASALIERRSGLDAGKIKLSQQDVAQTKVS